MALLQMVHPVRGAWTYSPISVSLDSVAAVTFLNSTDVFFKNSYDPDDEICAVTFKHPICVGTIAEEGNKPIMKSVIIVTGSFRENAIMLGLDEDGSIQEAIDYANC
jgi:hypothetical protein